MNVISGKLKGLILESSKDSDLRPTKDRIKKSVFDILRFKIKDKVFVDLFGGTGQIGIEAYSQGAKKVIISEYNYNNIKIIQKNLDMIKFKNNIKLIKSDVIDLFKNNLEELECADIYFLDPPYNNIDLLNQVLNLILNLSVLPKMIIIENLKENYDKIIFGKIEKIYLQKIYNYGKIIINLCEKT